MGVAFVDMGVVVGGASVGFWAAVVPSETWQNEVCTSGNNYITTINHRYNPHIHTHVLVGQSFSNISHDAPTL